MDGRSIIGNAQIYGDSPDVLGEYINARLAGREEDAQQQDAAAKQRAQQQDAAAKQRAQQQKGWNDALLDYEGGYIDDTPELQQQMDALMKVNAELQGRGLNINDVRNPMVAQYRDLERRFIDNETHSQGFQKEVGTLKRSIQQGIKEGKYAPDTWESVVIPALKQRKQMAWKDRFGFQMPQIDPMAPEAEPMDRYAFTDDIRGVSTSSSWQDNERAGSKLKADSPRNRAQAEQWATQAYADQHHGGDMDKAIDFIHNTLDSQVATKTSSKVFSQKGKSDSNYSYSHNDAASVIPVYKGQGINPQTGKLQPSNDSHAYVSKKSIGVRSKGSAKKTIRIGDSSTGVVTYIDGEPTSDFKQNINGVSVSSIDLVPIGGNGEPMFMSTVGTELGTGVDLKDAISEKAKQVGNGYDIDGTNHYEWMVNGTFTDVNEDGEKVNKKILIPFDVARDAFPGLSEMTGQEPVSGSQAPELDLTDTDDEFELDLTN